MAEVKIQIIIISRRFQNIISPLFLARTNLRRQRIIISWNRQNRSVVIVYKFSFRVINSSSTWAFASLRRVDVKLGRQRKRPNSILKRSKRKQSKLIIILLSKIYRTAKVCLFIRFRTISLYVKDVIFEVFIMRLYVSSQVQISRSKPSVWISVIR